MLVYSFWRVRSMTMSLCVETRLLPAGRMTEIWIDGGRFVAGPLDNAQTYSGGYAVPGLVDAHAHLALASPAPPGSDEDATVRASARAHLDAGVLLIREPGSPNRASSRIRSTEGLPTVITAGRFLAPSGRYFPGLARETKDEDLPDVVLDEHRRSGGWVKVIGDFFDESGRFIPNYRDETLREAADRVHAAGGRITMHAMIPESIQQAIDSGFNAIEHGSIMVPGQVEAMANAGMTWVPTAVIDEIIRDSAVSMVGAEGGAWLSAALDGHGDAIREAHSLGVRILAGTDAGMTPHGVVAQEIRLLHAFGLPPESALGAGSWEAREYLGLPGVEIGAAADLVVFPDDPREDLDLLDHPTIIIMGGRAVRLPKT